MCREMRERVKSERSEILLAAKTIIIIFAEVVVASNLVFVR